MTIELTPQELEQCRAAARARTIDSRNKGFKNSREYEPGYDDFEWQTSSYAAEIAVSRVLGSSIQTGIGGNGKPDIVFEGVEYEVKSTTGKGGFLLVPPESLKNERQYVLVVVNGRKCDVKGFADGYTIQYDGGRLTKFGKGSRPAIWSFPADKLSHRPTEQPPF